MIPDASRMILDASRMILDGSRMILDTPWMIPDSPRMVPDASRMTPSAFGVIRYALGIIRGAPGIAANGLGTMRERLDATRSGFVCSPEEEAMTREDYEERLRALDAQLQADVALVHAGHEARVRSLESLWQAAAAGDGKAAIPAAPHETKRPPGATFDDLCEALPRLPEVFDKRDIVRVLGYTPPYTTLVRALDDLKGSGEIADGGGSGYRRSFRKVEKPEGA
jgi:hypothetical protein